MASSNPPMPEKGICAHRGDSKNAPENTLPAFLMAAEKGAHMIEFDVQMTADGELVILHDPTVDRTTDGTGEVTSLTSDYVRSLDAGAWFSEEFRGTRVPTLHEVLAADIPAHIWLNVHTRAHGERDEEYMARLAAAIEDNGRAGQIVLACFADQAPFVRQRLPQIKICNMTGQSHAGSNYPEVTIQLGADFLQFFGWHERTGEAVELLHRHGIKVNFFKADAEDEILKLFELGVDFVLTDDLDAGLAAWNKFAGG